MKKFFSKILIATFVLSFFLAPASININKLSLETNISLAQQVLTSIKGSGTWSVGSSGSTSTGTVVGTTQGYPNGSYSGKFWIPAIGANAEYTGTVTNNQFQGTWTAPGNVTSGGTWNGNFSYGTNINLDTGGLAGNGVVAASTVNPSSENYEYGCDFWPGTWHLCIMSWIYQLIFVPVAFFARLSAQILDFFIYYSISSESYTSNFIEKGWGIMRDIANVFFIIALIYVAVKTILDLSTSNNKRMIGMIIVVALLINFSLFATKIVIDASNILARVFYANIESVDKNGVPKPAEDGGEKSITVGLVKQFDPHTIFGTKSGSSISDNAGTFAAVLFLSILMMGYMVFMFLSVTLLFVSRVVMLWILMIMSPIAFISMTMPGIKIPSFNFSEWWNQLSDNAFLAPIFIFFLYLIITFGDIVKVVTRVDSTSIPTVGGGGLNGADDATFTKYMGVVIPFILIFILLATAKRIAVKMSGEMGSMINKAGVVVGGFAGGALLGGAAALGTKGIGRLANNLGDGKFAERLRDRGVIRDENGNVIGAKKGVGAWFARQQLKTIDYGKKGTFDVRQTKLGNFIQKESGLNFQSASAIGLGTQKGGYLGYQDRVNEQNKKDAELYKTSMSDPQVKEFTIKRREKFLEEKADEAEKELRDKNKGVILTDAQISIARNGAKATYKDNAPKIYEKAEQLNQERMIMFKDRIGQTGLISALAHTGMDAASMTVTQGNFTDKGMQTAYLKAFKEKKKKQAREHAAINNLVFDEKLFEKKHELDLLDKTSKTYKESKDFDIGIAKTINDEKANKVKIGIGIAAGLATGGVLGAMTGSALIGTAAGISGGANMATSEMDKSTKDKIIDRMDKEAKNTQNLANRIADLTEIMKKGKDLTRTETDPITHAPIKNPTTGNPITTKINLFNGDQVDKDKLRARLIANDTEIDQLKEAAKTSSNPDLIKRLNEAKLEREILQGLKTSEEKLFELTGKKPGASTPPPATP